MIRWMAMAALLLAEATMYWFGWLWFSGLAALGLGVLVAGVCLIRTTWTD